MSACKCGKGHASEVDGLCRYCREETFSRAEGKRVGVRSAGLGMTLDQAERIAASKRPPRPQFHNRNPRT